MGPILQLVRGQQCGGRFLQAGDVLRQVDQRDSEVAGAVQDAERQGGDQHQVADLGLAVLPEQDAPGDHAGGQDRRQDGMHEPDMLQVIEAAAAGGHFAFHLVADPPLFAEGRTEGPHDIEVADDVDQFAVDAGGFPRIFAVTLPSPVEPSR